MTVESYIRRQLAGAAGRDDVGRVLMDYCVDEIGRTFVMPLSTEATPTLQAAAQPSINAAKPEIRAAREELDKMLTQVPEGIDRVQVARRLMQQST
jgi:hypothetical protein